MKRNDEIRELAEALHHYRASAQHHPRVDGKLAEAEINLWGVARVLEMEEQ